MNSTRNLKKAIDFEINRQVNLIENEIKLFTKQEAFNAANNSTVSMRHKEEANDYRYFPRPDIQPFYVLKNYIEEVLNKSYHLY